MTSTTKKSLGQRKRAIVWITMCSNYINERFHSNGYQKWDIRNDKEMSSFMHLNQHNT